MESLHAKVDAVNISGKISDIDSIIHILGNLPEEYEVAIESLEERLEDTSNKLSIEEVRTKLNARFARINKKKEKTKDELGFQALEKKKPTCRNCGKTGHTHWKCPSKPKNGVTSKSCLEIYSNKLCWYCGKPGHRGGDVRK